MRATAPILLIALLIWLVGCSGDAPGVFDGDAAAAGDTDTDADTDGDADTDADGDADTDADGDADTDADGDADTDADGDADTDADTDADGDADADTDTGSESDQSLPGHWECQGGSMWEPGTCVAVHQDGDGPCGDGQCNPAGGESKLSCPGDCDPGDAATLPCNDALDCIFLEWPLAESGSWDCDIGVLPPWEGTCEAVAGGPMQDTCDTMWDTGCEPEQGESDVSCPADCAGAGPECDGARDCVFLEWPPAP